METTENFVAELSHAVGDWWSEGHEDNKTNQRVDARVLARCDDEGRYSDGISRGEATGVVYKVRNPLFLNIEEDHEIPFSTFVEWKRPGKILVRNTRYYGPLRG